MNEPQRHQSSPDLTCPWSIIGALILLALVLAWFARGMGTLSIDAQTTELIQQLDGPAYAAVADVGNTLGESRYAIVLVGILIVLTAFTRRWRDLIFLIVLLALRGAGTISKRVFDSPRPTDDVAEVVHAFDGLGFPSGHSMTSSVAAGGIVFLAIRWKDFSRRRVRIALAVAWTLCVSLTAFARIWVGAHWLTDTVGGTLIGVVFVLLSANLSALAVSRWPHSEP